MPAQKPAATWAPTAEGKKETPAMPLVLTR